MADTNTPRTPAEIAQLKANWLKDPHWDIYTTEGFEAHESELRGFQAGQEILWGKERAKAREQENARLDERAYFLGIPKGREVIRLIEQLEKRVADLETEVGNVRWLG